MGTRAKFECYIARYQDKVVYVGSGAKGRHKHINSGKSHVVELNQMFLQGYLLDVEVIPKKNKESALLHEEALIRELEPVFNTVWTKAGKRDRDEKIAEFMETIIEKPPMKFEVVYQVKEEAEPDPDKLGLVFKEGYKWSSVIIKDVPVSYARLHKHHVAHWSKKLKYDVYVYSVVIYLTIEQLDYLQNIRRFDFGKVDKVMEYTREKHCDLREQPYAEGLYACRIERNALKYGGKGFNHIKVKTKTEEGLIDREHGIMNGTICSVKFIYMTGHSELYLDTVVVKG